MSSRGSLPAQGHAVPCPCSSPEGGLTRLTEAVDAMSQKTVQLVIARLITDEEVRLQFLDSPLETLTAFRDQGFELTGDEIEALLETDRNLWTYAAGRIHPRLQRCSFRCR